MDPCGTRVVRWLSSTAYGPTAESCSSTIGHITLGMKQTGERSAGNPHAAFEVAGAGNVTKRVGLRTAAKVADNTPDSKESAPVLDPTIHYVVSSSSKVFRGSQFF